MLHEVAGSHVECDLESKGTKNTWGTLWRTIPIPKDGYFQQFTNFERE